MGLIKKLAGEFFIKSSGDYVSGLLAILAGGEDLALTPAQERELEKMGYKVDKWTSIDGRDGTIVSKVSASSSNRGLFG